MGQRSKIVREFKCRRKSVGSIPYGASRGANGYFGDILDAIAFKPEIAVIANASSSMWKLR